MDKEQFIQNFADILDDTEASTLTLDTVFRDIDEWSSLTALSLIAMCVDEYGVTLKGDDVEACTTIGDICRRVEKKL